MLFYIVHLEVTKLGLEGLQRGTPTQRLLRRVTGFMIGFGALLVLAILFQTVLGWTVDSPPGASLPLTIAVFAGAYIWLVRLSATRPDLELV